MNLFKLNMSSINFMLLICLFSYPSYSQKTISQENDEFEVIVEWKFKPIYEQDTIYSVLHQKYISKPKCSNIMYSEYNSRDSSTTLVDTLLNKYAIWAAHNDMAYYEKLNSIHYTEVFTPLIHGFDSWLKMNWREIEVKPYQKKYFSDVRDTLGIKDSSFMTINYDANHKPTEMIYQNWMDSLNEFDSYKIIKTFAAKNICIQFPSDSTNNLKIVDCSAGKQRNYDGYEELKDFNISKIPMSDTRNENEFALSQILDSLNLVFVFTESCLPCHWFINESNSLFDFLKKQKTKFIAVMPSSFDSKGLSNLKRTAKIDFEIFFDNKSELAKKYGIKKYPFFLLVDKKGNIIDYQIGYRKNGLADVETLIENRGD
jgi:AhpC/TSA family protein